MFLATGSLAADMTSELDTIRSVRELLESKAR